MTEPVLIYRLPGSRDIVQRRLTNTDSTLLTFGTTTIRPWPGEHFDADHAAPDGSDTPRATYIGRIGSLIDRLRSTGGKTVIARRISGKFHTYCPDAMVREYFALFPDMFCFAFYHPLTGWWMGASPELLLHYDATTQTAATQALAGTRLREGWTDQPWSDKNIDEHGMVVDDMTERIRAAAPGASMTIGERSTLGYGAIEHLCTPITVTGVTAAEARRIEDALHPTAAVGGYPRTKACADIRAIEDSPRQCYGGLISVDTPDGRTTYVILRCVHFDYHRWDIYTGSGITADSDASDEWNETAIKAEPLIQLLSHY